MMQVYLINILFFCGILFILALTVAVIQGVLILMDARRMTKEVKEKVLALAAVLDIVTLLAEGLNRTKKKVAQKFASENSTLVAFAAGLKKGLQVFMGKKGVDE